MEKIDYGDINKFLVSIGLVLISLAVLTPYLYLKENFGLYIELENLKKFQEPIQKLIEAKQNQVIKIQTFIPFISMTFMLLGIVSSTLGLVRWFKRQAKIDEKFDKEIQKLDLEIESLTPQEKERKARLEVQEIEMEEQTQLNKNLEDRVPVVNQYQIDYLRVENDIIQRLKNFNSSAFDILPQQRLGNRFEIDILLRATTEKYSDRIIEIKYFKNGLQLSIVQKTLTRLNMIIDYYRETARKRIIPIIVLIYKKDSIDVSQISNYNKKVRDYAKNIPNLARLKIEFINEEQLNDFDPQRLIKK